MTAIWVRESKKLVKASLGAMGVAITTHGLAFACWVDSASAQITPDNTMGGENSRVTSTGDVDAINGGTTRGANLFHSFREFNVDEGRAAVFANPAGIENILTRVTGANPSIIFGTLGVTGNANLFLINPNGIIFGANARLDVGGSFVATTANAIGFGDRGFFSATNPSSPELLTVNPSALLFNQMRAAAIQNNSVAPSGLNPSSKFTAEGLRVPDGKSLLLVGGDINMNGGRLYAFGGRVELGSLAGVGTIGLNENGNNLSLSFLDGAERGNVFLSNGAVVDVTAGNGGSIAVNARNLEMTGDSGLRGGIESGLGSDNSQAGNIDINATRLAIADSSKIQTEVAQNAVGNSGNININADSLSLSNKSFIATSTNGQGNAGNITIDTSSLSVEQSLLAANSNGQGNAGNINIQARNLILFDQGSAYTDIGDSGKGQGGNFNITTESLSLNNGAVFIASTKNEGNAGNITINTGSLSVSNNSFLAASANGQQGDAGNININARDRVLFDRAGNIYTNVTDKGNGGDIKINTGSLSLTNGSLLDGGTSGVGNAGNLTFNTGSFSVTNDSRMSVSTSGVGEAGNITIDTNSLFIANESFLAASANGQGKAGNININARDVSLVNGAKVYTDVNQLPFNNATQVKGDGGNINIKSESLSLTDGAQLISNTQGEGNAGDITIDTGSLWVTSESFLAANANGQQGNAGDININARDRVLFDRGSAFSNVEFCSLIAVGCTPSNNAIIGNGGDITIEAPSLQLINGSFLATGVGNDLFGQTVEGNAGRISIYLRNDLYLDQSFITTRLFTNGIGKAGDIDIRAGSVFSNRSLISASTQGRGNAGGVSLQVTDAITLANSEISTAIQQGATGDAQGINITARSLFLSDGTQLNALTSGAGKAGNILINTTDKVSVSGTNTRAVPTNFFQSNIPPRFNSPPNFSDRVSSGIFTSAEPNSTGDAGDLTVNTDNLLVQDGATVGVQSLGTGTAGNMRLNVRSIRLDNSALLSADTRSFLVDSNSEQATININSQNLFVSRNSNIFTNAEGENVIGGNINIDTDLLVAFENSDISANSENFRGGNVRIDASGIFGTQFRAAPDDRTSDITATGASPQFSGSVDIDTPGIDPNNGLVNLPSVPVDTQVTRACTPSRGQNQSEFIVTGRGGLPPNPTEVLSSDAISIDWVALQPTTENQSSPTSTTSSTAPPATIVEATGWVIDRQGKVILTASTVPTQPHSSWQSSTGCKL